MEIKRVVIYSIVFVLILITGYKLSGYYLDKSQTIVEARERGAPFVDKVWTLKEYELFYGYLVSLPDDIDYPMLTSEKSSRLFKRFINSLDKVIEKPLTDSLVFAKIIKLKKICHKTLKLYIDKDIKTQKYTDEIAHLYGIQLKLFLNMHKMGKKVMSTVKEDNNSLKVRMKGLELMKDGAAVQISIILDLLSESNAFKENDILISYFKHYAPELLTHFDERRKKVLKRRIVETSKKVNALSTKMLLKDISNSL